MNSKINRDSHYVWQTYHYEYSNEPNTKLMYYYFFFPKARLCLVDYNYATKEIKEKEGYERWSVCIDTNEADGPYGDNMSYYFKVKGNTIKEVKRKALKLCKEFVEKEVKALMESSKRIGLLL